MKAADSKLAALDALRYMAAADNDREFGRDRAFGYAWSALSHIAGLEACPLPSEIGPPKPEYAPAFAPWERP